MNWSWPSDIAEEEIEAVGAKEDGGPATLTAAVGRGDVGVVGTVSLAKSNMICVGDMGVYGMNVLDYIRLDVMVQ